MFVERTSISSKSAMTIFFSFILGFLVFLFFSNADCQKIRKDCIFKKSISSFNPIRQTGIIAKTIKLLKLLP